MTARVDNLRSRGRLLRLLPIVVALACCVAAAGVVARPVSSVAKAEQARAVARRRALDSRLASDRYERFELAGGFGRLDELAERIDQALPRDPSAVELCAVLRLIAHVHTVRLDQFDLDQPLDAGFGPDARSGAVLADRVVERRTSLAGRARLGALVRFVHDVEDCGYPVAVRRVTVERTRPDDVEFGFELELGLFHRAPRELALPTNMEGGA